ncbi:MAG: DUF3793 family protein [Oscillospiraceae bacterium]
MSDELIVRQCSPTLAGLKTGNMFSVGFESKAGTIERIRGLNRRLAPYGLRMLPLRFMEKRVLVYMYSPERLRADLERPQVRELLSGLGYDLSSAGGCIARLRRRMGDGGDFPHEVGLFLGYPAEDVRGFIENRAGCKCVGCWKVYGDVKAAKMTFESFEKCTRDNCGRLRRGCTLEQLISQ